MSARQERLLAEGLGHLWQSLGQKPVDFHITVAVPRRGSRPAREANLEVRFGSFTLNPPHRKPQLGAVDRIEACLAIDMVVAWRIYYLTTMGGETPDVPCTVFFEDYEWKALVAFITRNVIPPPQVPTLREAVRMVASRGGFLGRKGD